jgi:hypothetical protein
MKATLAAACAAVCATLALPAAQAADGGTCEKILPEDQVSMTKAAVMEKFCVYLKRMKDREHLAETTNASLKTLAEASQCKKESGKLREQLERQFEVRDPKCP